MSPRKLLTLLRLLENVSAPWNTVSQRVAQALAIALRRSLGVEEEVPEPIGRLLVAMEVFLRLDAPGTRLFHLVETTRPLGQVSHFFFHATSDREIETQAEAEAIIAGLEQVILGLRQRYLPPPVPVPSSRSLIEQAPTSGVVEIYLSPRHGRPRVLS